MVLKFFLFASLFLFISCTDVKFDNPDDPESPNYIANRLSSSSSVKKSSSSVAVSSSSSKPNSSSSASPSSSSIVSSSSKASSSSSKPSSSSSILPSSSSLAQSSSSVTVSSSSSMVSSSSSVPPSSSSVAKSSSSAAVSSSSSKPSSSSVGCTAANNTSTQYCSNGTMKTYGSMTDDGGRTYKSVVIGTQTWMAENLNYNATDSKCYGDNTGGDSQGNCAKYGRLYSWEVAMTVCPSGWRLPSNADWNILMKFVDPSCSDNNNCVEAGTKLKATSGWNNNGNGNDTYGFFALPGGYGNSGGSFSNVGNYGYWWSAYEYDSDYAGLRTIYYNLKYVYYSYDFKDNLYSVRCVKD